MFTNKSNILTCVVGILVLIVICLITFIVLSHVPDEQVSGADLLKYNGRNHSYIVGAVDVARIMDIHNKFECDGSKDSDQTDTEIVLTVVDEIKHNKLLQDQPGAFAVLNAYHKSYCTKR